MMNLSSRFRFFLFFSLFCGAFFPQFPIHAKSISPFEISLSRTDIKENSSFDVLFINPSKRRYDCPPFSFFEQDLDHFGHFVAINEKGQAVNGVFPVQSRRKAAGDLNCRHRMQIMEGTNIRGSISMKNGCSFNFDGLGTYFIAFCITSPIDLKDSGVIVSGITKFSLNENQEISAYSKVSVDSLSSEIRKAFRKEFEDFFVAEHFSAWREDLPF